MVGGEESDEEFVFFEVLLGFCCVFLLLFVEFVVEFFDEVFDMLLVLFLLLFVFLLLFCECFGFVYFSFDNIISLCCVL